MDRSAKIALPAKRVWWDGCARIADPANLLPRICGRSVKIAPPGNSLMMHRRGAKIALPAKRVCRDCCARIADPANLLPRTGRSVKIAPPASLVMGMGGGDRIAPPGKRMMLRGRGARLAPPEGSMLTQAKAARIAPPGNRVRLTGRSATLALSVRGVTKARRARVFLLTAVTGQSHRRLLIWCKITHKQCLTRGRTQTTVRRHKKNHLCLDPYFLLCSFYVANLSVPVAVPTAFSASPGNARTRRACPAGHGSTGSVR